MSLQKGKYEVKVTQRNLCGAASVANALRYQKELCFLRYTNFAFRSAGIISILLVGLDENTLRKTYKSVTSSITSFIDGGLE